MVVEAGGKQLSLLGDVGLVDHVDRESRLGIMLSVGGGDHVDRGKAKSENSIKVYQWEVVGQVPRQLNSLVLDHKSTNVHEIRTNVALC